MLLKSVVLKSFLKPFVINAELLNSIVAMAFYAVRRGKIPGIYSTWGECQEQILKFPGARYKKFATRELALEFVNGSDNPEEAAMGSGDWVGSCKQTLMELMTSCTQAVPKLNKYLNTLPSELSTKQEVEAGFHEAKADIIMCKGTLSKLMDLISGQTAAALPKRKISDTVDEVASTSKRVKKSSPVGGEVPVVYTDGACFNNGTSRAQAGIGVWWGVNDERNVSERLGGRQANNRAEIYAACKAVQQAIDLGYRKLEIRTDSQFMINCMTKWISGWKKNCWQLSSGGPVKNADELQELDRLCSQVKITWTHVKGHSGIEGNEHADRLANDGARQT